MHTYSYIVLLLLLSLFVPESNNALSRPDNSCPRCPATWIPNRWTSRSCSPCVALVLTERPTRYSCPCPPGTWSWWIGIPWPCSFSYTITITLGQYKSRESLCDRRYTFRTRHENSDREHIFFHVGYRVLKFCKNRYSIQTKDTYWVRGIV